MFGREREEDTGRDLSGWSWNPSNIAKIEVGLQAAASKWTLIEAKFEHGL
jgi:hypothetical protein